MNALSGKIVHTYEEFNSRLTALIEELLKTINIKSLEIKSPGNESHLAWSLILIVFKSSSIKAVSLELNSSMLFFFTHFISFLAGRSLSWTISWYMGSGHTFISYGYRRYAFQRHHCGRVEKCHSRWSLRNARLPESELHRLDCRHFETSARLEADTAAGTKFLSFFFVLFLFTKFIYVVVDIWSWKELNWTLICLIKLNEIEKVSQSLWVRGCAIWYLTHENPSPLNNWNQNSNQDWRGLKRFPSFTFK